jgi:hypothetical protein
MDAKRLHGAPDAGFREFQGVIQFRAKTLSAKGTVQ